MFEFFKNKYSPIFLSQGGLFHFDIPLNLKLYTHTIYLYLFFQNNPNTLHKNNYNVALFLEINDNTCIQKIVKMYLFSFKELQKIYIVVSRRFISLLKSRLIHVYVFETQNITFWNYLLWNMFSINM